MSGDRTSESLVDLLDTRTSLNLEINKDEAYREQRVHANWLRLEDRNISFFHRHATSRKKSNLNWSLVREDDDKITFKDEFGERAQDYFQSLFALKGVSNLAHLFTMIEVKIENINRFLLDRLKVEEIVAAIRGMGPTKALEEDGFRDIFSKNIGILLVQKSHNFAYVS